MKIIGCADLHISATKPRYRTDKDYLKTCIHKLDQIIAIANEEDCPIVCAGDLVDHYTVSHKVVNAILDSLSVLKHEFYLVLGQHDVPYHNFDIDKSPIGTLLKANRIILLNNKWNDGLFGVNFGEEEIPETKSSTDTLVIHTAITENDPPFFLEDAISADYALNEAFKFFKVIVSGDFHQPFTLKKHNRLLVNCGPMMRKSLDQADIQPCVWKIDTDEPKAVRINLLVENPDDVFNFKLADKEKSNENKFSDDMQNLIQTLKDQDKVPSIFDTAKVVMKQRKSGKNIRILVNKFLSGGKK